ncbi:hypothetical protein H0H81_005016 [Sphagnurus paluster]|uniref:Uncharacterized protein n=1 Tax=Sphagnurus paluster TaxID=117069 RepID=A0A9P7FLF8_9AGAR|nr:hypothetical protein H0H81_005016 [Sphagnurus paluster]
MENANHAQHHRRSHPDPLTFPLFPPGTRRVTPHLSEEYPPQVLHKPAEFISSLQSIPFSLLPSQDSATQHLADIDDAIQKDIALFAWCPSLIPLCQDENTVHYEPTPRYHDHGCVTDWDISSTPNSSRPPLPSQQHKTENVIFDNQTLHKGIQDDMVEDTSPASVLTAALGCQKRRQSFDTESLESFSAYNMGDGNTYLEVSANHSALSSSGTKHPPKRARTDAYRGSASTLAFMNMVEAHLKKAEENQQLTINLLERLVEKMKGEGKALE